MPKIVVGIAGEMLSGKSTAASFFEETYKAEILNFSRDTLKPILEILALEPSRENYQKLVTALRGIYGQEVLAVPIVDRVNQSSSEFILVDGFRKPEEVEKLREIPNFKLLYIKSDPENRYQRLKNRSEKTGESLMTREEFHSREQDEADKDVQKLELLADCTIENNSSVEDLQEKLRKYYQEAKC